MKLDIEKAFEILKPFCLSKKLIEPWSFTEEALENTLKYITALSYNCYIYNGKQLYKLEFKTTSPLLKKHLTSRNISTKIRETLKKKKEWRIMQCIIKPFGISEDFIFAKFLDKIKLEGIYIFSLTDSQLLRKDFRTPWFKDSTDFRPPFLPMFAYSGHQEFYDIPIPNIDELTFIKNPPEIPEYEWSEKQSKAVFRGSSTGCGVTPETNQRIKISQINSPYLDAGLTSLTKQLKYDGGIKQTPKLPLVSKLDMFKEQSLYKIIIHIDGNVHAYRWLPSFLTGSLIFRVQSPYTHWLDSKFKEGKHYISIKEDLSDLLDKIIKYKDLKKGEKIALAGKKLAQKYLTDIQILKNLEKILNF